MSNRRKLRLGLAAYGTGWDLDAWRLPEASNTGLRDPSVILDIARTAERGKLDYVFAGSALGSEPDRLNRIYRWDNFVYAGYAAALTKNLGFLMSVNSSFEHPYGIARQLATLDNFTAGRTALNVVFGIDRDGDPIGNYGKNPMPTETTKYDRAREFTAVVNRLLYESWDDDLLLDDKAGGALIRPGSWHQIDHHGEHFDVRGPLNVPPPVQPHIPIVQVGLSEESLRFGADYAQVRFSPYFGISRGKEEYRKLKERVAANGRDPEKFKIIPGITFYLAGTTREAVAKFNEINALQLTEEIPSAFSAALGVDLSRVRDTERVLDVVDVESLDDGALKPFISDRARDVKNDRELLRQVLTAQVGEDATLRELYQYVQRSRHEQQPAVVGDAAKIADWLEENLEEHVLDGVQLFPPYHRGPADLFVDLVVPELQRRGIFRTEYEAPTLQGLLDTDDY
ncbi:FMN-dependent oxidoreductase (nitrilotriacetate monooxygenase family) [Kribbella aluminosa]|uniref:FMN-dependent oxidoreductase (Nitrilotriacetate monooxygenase family) n=1 Tax=Kribbella aluminosa TaxID=416017 RepID=A0ABS4UJ95_9ACTN|nr:NtaA/DmoA family FMN-dependent monooxygenase [Kribbella aluminosa]MBP2351688.1 FMN-dependent oxidoreductase (nitrilotriacetate monooxygenase family) [Kribbella aluminosa]